MTVDGGSDGIVAGNSAGEGGGVGPVAVVGNGAESPLANAVAQAAKNGVRIDVSEIYVTASPCLTCFKLLANCGVRKIFYREFYRDERINTYAREAGITLVYMGAQPAEPGAIV